MPGKSRQSAAAALRRYIATLKTRDFLKLAAAFAMLYLHSAAVWSTDACFPWIASVWGIEHYYPTAQAACSVYAGSGTNTLGGTFVTTSTAINFSGTPPAQQAQCLRHHVETDGGTGICRQNPDS